MIWKAIRFFIGYMLIALGNILLIWLYTQNIYFGEGIWAVITKYAFLWSIIGCTVFGIILVAYDQYLKQMTKMKLFQYFILLFMAFKFAIWLGTVIVGVPMDTNYSFGMNAIMIAQAAFIFMPVVIMVISIIAFTMLVGPSNLFSWLWKIGILIGILVGLSYVIPIILNAY